MVKRVKRTVSGTGRGVSKKSAGARAASKIQKLRNEPSGSYMLTSQTREKLLRAFSPRQQEGLRKLARLKKTSRMMNGHNFGQYAEWDFWDYHENNNYFDRTKKQLRCECGRILRYQFIVKNRIDGRVIPLGSKHFEDYTHIPLSVAKQLAKGIVAINLGLDEILVNMRDGKLFKGDILQWIKSTNSDEVSELTRVAVAYDIPTYSSDFRRSTRNYNESKLAIKRPKTGEISTPKLDVVTNSELIKRWPHDVYQAAIKEALANYFSEFNKVPANPPKKFNNNSRSIIQKGLPAEVLGMRSPEFQVMADIGQFYESERAKWNDLQREEEAKRLSVLAEENEAITLKEKNTKFFRGTMKTFVDLYTQEEIQEYSEDTADDWWNFYTDQQFMEELLDMFSERALKKAFFKSMDLAKERKFGKKSEETLERERLEREILQQEQEKRAAEKKLERQTKQREQKENAKKLVEENFISALKSLQPNSRKVVLNLTYTQFLAYVGVQSTKIRKKAFDEYNARFQVAKQELNERERGMEEASRKRQVTSKAARKRARQSEEARKKAQKWEKDLKNKSVPKQKELKIISRAADRQKVSEEEAFAKSLERLKRKYAN